MRNNTFFGSRFNSPAVKTENPFHGLFLLRNQTRGNAYYAGYVANRECPSRELPLFIFIFPKQAGPQQHFLNKGKYIF